MSSWARCRRNDWGGSQFPVRLTQARRKVVAKIDPELAGRLLTGLTEGHRHACGCELCQARWRTDVQDAPGCWTVPGVPLASAIDVVVYNTTGADDVDIARLAGYRHPEYMSVAFRRLTGETPGQYRRKAQSDTPRGLPK